MIIIYLGTFNEYAIILKFAIKYDYQKIIKKPYSTALIHELMPTLSFQRSPCQEYFCGTKQILD